MAAAERTGSLVPPKHILNAPTRLMKSEGYGKGYVYDHDTEAGFSGQEYFPPEMPRETYYRARRPRIRAQPARKAFVFRRRSALGRPNATDTASGRLPPIPAKSQRPHPARLRQLGRARARRRTTSTPSPAPPLARNQAAGITGLLLHQGDALLRHPRRPGAAGAGSAWRSIIRDPRHSRLRVLREAAIADRRFDNWSFGSLPEGQDGDRARRRFHLEPRTRPAIDLPLVLRERVIDSQIVFGLCQN